VRIALATIVSALVAAAFAEAAEEPGTIASARLGSLSVTSAAYVSAKGVDLLGVWQDDKVACTVNRRLTVRAEVDYVPFGGGPRRAVRTGRFKAANCSEGGPSVGFSLTARKLGFACGNGRWKPARYNFLTRTTEPTRKLKSTASLIWIKRARCGS
jgi:hypothetical protein